MPGLSVDTVYDSDGNVIQEHKPRTKTIIQQMYLFDFCVQGTF